MVLSTEEISEVKGTSQKGNSYAFWARRSNVFDGKQTVIVSEIYDSPGEFPELQFYAPATFLIERARMDGRQMVLNGLLVG